MSIIDRESALDLIERCAWTFFEAGLAAAIVWYSQAEWFWVPVIATVLAFGKVAAAQMFGNGTGATLSYDVEPVPRSMFDPIASIAVNTLVPVEEPDDGLTWQ